MRRFPGRTAEHGRNPTRRAGAKLKRKLRTKLKEILVKVAKGETLADDEKSFLGSYDPQAELDSAAAAARKRADAEAKAAKDALAALQGEFDDYKAANDPAKGQGEIARLTKRLEKLEAERDAANAKSAALERASRIRSLAKDAGISAAKGVDPKSLDMLVDHLMAEVDLDDGDAVKAAFDGFRSANAGLIAAATVGGSGQKGNPGAHASAANPFSKRSWNVTEQIKMRIEDPAKADSLRAAAEAETN